MGGEETEYLVFANSESKIKLYTNPQCRLLFIFLLVMYNRELEYTEMISIKLTLLPSSAPLMLHPSTTTHLEVNFCSLENLWVMSWWLCPLFFQSVIMALGNETNTHLQNSLAMPG